jgi:hypothetical protein
MALENQIILQCSFLNLCHIETFQINVTHLTYVPIFPVNHIDKNLNFI